MSARALYVADLVFACAYRAENVGLRGLAVPDAVVAYLTLRGPDLLYLCYDFNR